MLITASKAVQLSGQECFYRPVWRQGVGGLVRYYRSFRAMIPLITDSCVKRRFFSIHLPLIEARELQSIFPPPFDRIFQRIHHAGVKCHFKSYAEEQFRHI